METELLELEKTIDLPGQDEQFSPKILLARLLSEIALDEHYTGAVFAEADDNFVEFKVSLHRQYFLTKTGDIKTIARYHISNLTRFVTYINRDLFKLKPASMCSGILRVKFADEEHERLFSVFSRRSGTLGDFIQIDQFKNHL